MIELDAASVLLQWSTGGLLFCWVTTRRGEVGPGYGWLLRGLYGLLAAMSLWLGLVVVETVPLREAASAGVVLATGSTSIVVLLGRRRGVERLPARLDLVAPAVGLVGVVAAGLVAGEPAWLSVARMVVGAAFLGSITDAMLLGHWYLVQPGLPREPLLELVGWVGRIWPVEVALLLFPEGMVSVLVGTIDDGYNGLLGWFWVACAITTIGLVIATHLVLRERQYSAMMAATGLLYLAILTAFGTDLVARALLS